MKIIPPPRAHGKTRFFGPGAAFGTLLAVAFLPASPALAQQQHTLPYLMSASSPQQGFVRIINRSDRGGTVRIHAIDDNGDRYGPVDLTIGAEATVHFTSQHLEGGGHAGLSDSVGDREGDWRLEFITELDIEALAYMRVGGFLASMHDVVQGVYMDPETPGEFDVVRHRVRFFNPGSNANQVSRLRVINTAGVENEVVITGVDDRGDPAPGGEVRVTLPPYGARTISAQDLERGAAGLDGALGDGSGKWQLTVFAETLEERVGERPIQVMSLLWSRPTGNLSNLSTVGAGNDSNRGGPGTDWIYDGAGDDVLNPGDNDDSYDAVFGSAGNDTIVYSDSGSSAFQWLGYFGLGTGIRAMVDGVANVATVDKGASGTDTIVDIVNPLNAAKEAPYGAFGLGGSPFDDHFDLALDEGQWMEARGGPGDDRFQIRSGRVRINYRQRLAGIDVDLEAGRANNDGYGNVDTFVGRVYEVQGGPGDDTIRGSSRGDRLDGGEGDDLLVPRGGDWSQSTPAFSGDDSIFGSYGNDTIDFRESTGPRAGQNLYYDPVWRDPIFRNGITVTIDGGSDRASVDKGPAGRDTIRGIATPLNSGGLSIQGTGFDDTFNMTITDDQWISVRGQAGNDTFNLTSSRSLGRIDYRDAPNGIDVDLGAGRAHDDGFGGVDTINGAFWEVRGSDFADVIRGSGNDESFDGRGGDDTIDGGGGYDQLRFHRSGHGAVQVDMGAGTVTGTWEGSAYTKRFSNIERVRGSNSDDTFRSGAGNDSLEGRDGRDTFVFGPGHGDDDIRDFSPGQDRIDLNALGLSNEDVRSVSSETSSGGTWIDLTGHGGGTINVRGVRPGDLGDSDFLL